MTEKDPKTFETFEADHSARHEVAEKRHQSAEAHQSKTETAKADLLAEARQEISNQSADKDKTLDRLKEANKAEEDQQGRMPANANLKKSALNNEIRHIRRKLNKGDRVGSKIIHQPLVRAVSDISSKTITRPSGLLGGGITAFLGTSAYLVFTKYIGLKYNYSVFLFLLVAGFILGLIIEAVFRLARGRSVS